LACNILLDNLIFLYSIKCGQDLGDILLKWILFHLSALARFAFGHNKHLKSIAAAYWKPQTNSLINSLPSLANIKDTDGGYPKQSQHMAHGGIVSPQIGPLRVGSDNSKIIRDGRVSSSSPLASSGIMHGSPLSDNSSHHSDSGILNDGFSNGAVNNFGPKPLDNALYSQCVLAMCTLAKDPSPRVGNLGRRVLSIIGIEQVVAKPSKPSGVRTSEATVSPSLARSSSWFDMNGGRSHFYLI
jgi:regulator-associated protein of mTOR